MVEIIFIMGIFLHHLNQLGIGCIWAIFSIQKWMCLSHFKQRQKWYKKLREKYFKRIEEKFIGINPAFITK
jgi:hypothetical protein